MMFRIYVLKLLSRKPSNLPSGVFTPVTPLAILKEQILSSYLNGSHKRLFKRNASWYHQEKDLAWRLSCQILG